MIAFLQSFLPRRRKPIRLRWPRSMVVIMGCDRESIDVEFDPDQRMRRIVVRTRQRPTRSPAFRG